MFLLISRSSLFLSNVGNSSLRFVSVSLVLTPTCCNSEIFMTSLYLGTSSNSVYVGNPGELPIWLFYSLVFWRLLLNFYFVFTLFLHCYLLHILLDSILRVDLRLSIIFPHITKCTNFYKNKLYKTTRLILGKKWEQIKNIFEAEKLKTIISNNNDLRFSEKFTCKRVTLTPPK